MIDTVLSVAVVAGGIVFIWLTGTAAFALQKWVYERKYGK